MAAEEPKSATKSSELFGATPLVVARARVVSRFPLPRDDSLQMFRPTRGDSLKAIPVNLPMPLVDTCAMVMSTLTTVLADSLRIIRPVRADSLRAALVESLSCARLLLARRFLRVCRLPMLTSRTIASLQPTVCLSQLARGTTRLKRRLVLPWVLTHSLRSPGIKVRRLSEK